MGREAWIEMEWDIGGGVVVAGVRVEVVGVVEGFGVAILALGRGAWVWLVLCCARVGLVGCGRGLLDDEW